MTVDRYDEQIAGIARVSKRSKRRALTLIRVQWEVADGLFDFAGSWEEDHCGCLTQVRCHERDAATPALTRLIRSDPRIPDDYLDIREHHLPIFAAWQRCIDAMGVRDPDVVKMRGALIDNCIRTAVGIFGTRRHFEETP